MEMAVCAPVGLERNTAALCYNPWQLREADECAF